MTNIRTFSTNDIHNLLSRTAIGADNFMREFLDERITATSFPPYNIEAIGDDQYKLTLAVAGFSRDEISIRVENGNLLIEGCKEKTEEDNRSFIHRGIAERDFTRQFKLMEYVVVTKATLSDGLLYVELKRELPEALKPRSIAID